MKKIIIIFLIGITLLVTGCNLGNNPNSKVEELLGKYQKLDDSIVISPTKLTPSSNLDEETYERYKELIKDQYKNLTYEIKEEKEDGNKATITTEIEVTDFKSIMEKYNYANYSDEEYNSKLLDKLEGAKDRVTYTIDFELTKDDNDKWSVDPLTTEMEDKLLGIY